MYSISPENIAAIQDLNKRIDAAAREFSESYFKNPTEKHFLLTQSLIRLGATISNLWALDYAGEMIKEENKESKNNKTFSIIGNPLN